MVELKRIGTCLLMLLATACSPGLQAEPLAQSLSIVLEEQAPQVLRPEEWNRWRQPLSQLYAAHSHAPLWVRSDGTLTPAASALLNEMATAETRGLRAADYEPERFSAPGAPSMREVSSKGENPALRDIAFSATAARFVSEIHRGRIDPRSVGYELDVPKTQLDIAQVLTELAASADAATTAALLDGLEPRWRRFGLLKNALARYRELAAQPELQNLPRPVAWPVRSGDQYAGVPMLRQLLQALGDLPAVLTAEQPQEHLDENDAAALKRFQGRHGLRETGALDESTYRALLVPMTSRVRQIELTLERLRWLPAQLDSPPIVVNLPQYKLFAFQTPEDREDAILSMDVIVGQEAPAFRTPVFAADMQYVVFRPYWDVPRSILLRELLPKIKANPNWVRRNGYEVVWTTAGDQVTQDVTAETIAALEEGRARLRQLPGPQNALGAIKFIAPNRHNVYLHDTPARPLFDEPNRAFSHGCVRVSDPVALAEHVLKANGGWTRERIRAAMTGPINQRVNLARPVRVFLIYASALAAEDGTVYFFSDIYGHDARLDAALRVRRS